MPRPKAGLAKKIGMPPGTLLYTDRSRVAAPELKLLSYDSHQAEEKLISPDELALCRQPG